MSRNNLFSFTAISLCPPSAQVESDIFPNSKSKNEKRKNRSSNVKEKNKTKPNYILVSTYVWEKGKHFSHFPLDMLQIILNV